MEYILYLKYLLGFSLPSIVSHYLKNSQTIKFAYNSSMLFGMSINQSIIQFNIRFSMLARVGRNVPSKLRTRALGLVPWRS